MIKLRCAMVADTAQGRTVNGVVNRYGYTVVDGEKQFGKIGEIDAQSDVQSFLDSCDYRLIMDALVKQCGGDFDFEPLQTMIQSVDMRDPIAVASYMEIFAEEFASLPTHVKEYYGNNPRNFARGCIDGSVIDCIRAQSVDNDGIEQIRQNSGEMDGTTAQGNQQPDIAGIMRQIDAINAKLGVATPGCDSGAKEGD